jgi:hypothetical protein
MTTPELLAEIIKVELFKSSLNEAEVKTISKSQAVSLIKKNKGKQFTVVYDKRDGSERVLTGRIGVTKYLRGGTLPYNPTSYGLLPVYDDIKEAYRMIVVTTIKLLKFGEVTYEVR